MACHYYILYEDYYYEDYYYKGYHYVDYYNELSILLLRSYSAGPCLSVPQWYSLRQDGRWAQRGSIVPPF